jgi:hypothetical protein
MSRKIDDGSMKVEHSGNINEIVMNETLVLVANGMVQGRVFWTNMDQR